MKTLEISRRKKKFKPKSNTLFEKGICDSYNIHSAPCEDLRKALMLACKLYQSVRYNFILKTDL